MSTDFEIYQHTIWNKGAAEPLRIPVLVVANTPDETLKANVARNGALDLPWLQMAEPHDRVAVIVGGGPSVADYIDEIKAWDWDKADEATIFAINGAATWLAKHADVWPAFQVSCDAKPETATLFENRVGCYLLASQCDPTLVDKAMHEQKHNASGEGVTLFHMIMEGVEDLLPPERVKKGGYALIGGGASSGNTALAIAYTMGYRTIHCYGFDSSHRDGASHAYPQPMNALIPTIRVAWAGKEYVSSVAMKAQAEKFQITGQRLKQLGCTIHVHGDGLLPAMWHTPPCDLTEREKYTRMWMEPGYRQDSPAEEHVDMIADWLPEKAVVLDLGCGPARAALKLTEMGHSVTCIDIAENARDKEAAHLPFLQWDMSQPIPLRAPYGYCFDVMEHVPPEQVEAVIANIADACPQVFFRIEFGPDAFGERYLGTPLHLTQRPAEWWTDALKRHFRAVEYKGEGVFLCKT